MPHLEVDGARVYQGDNLETLKTIPSESVHCCVTSPPYWGLRDYGHEGQIGLEETPSAYVARLVALFREVRRVLRDDGTLWLNLGDSYVSSNSPQVPQTLDTGTLRYGCDHRPPVPPNIKPKNLVGIPWRVAFALQDDGWYLRQDIIWHKPNPMPESVTDRCTKAHEYIFLMSKSQKYYYDGDAIKEGAVSAGETRGGGKKVSADNQYLPDGSAKQNLDRYGETPEKRNRRSVWTVATKPYSGAHFAVFPPKLIEPCIMAGCPRGGTVLDPFTGSGTTGEVALSHGREFLGMELNPDYFPLIRERLTKPVQLGLFS